MNIIQLFGLVSECEQKHLGRGCQITSPDTQDKQLTYLSYQFFIYSCLGDKLVHQGVDNCHQHFNFNFYSSNNWRKKEKKPLYSLLAFQKRKHFIWYVYLNVIHSSWFIYCISLWQKAAQYFDALHFSKSRHLLNFSHASRTWPGCL